MSKTVRIEVTAMDIAMGVASHACKCPIALACVRAGVKTPFVRHKVIDTGSAILPLPRRAINFIRDFDAGKPRRPFSFSVEIPDVA